MVTELRARVDKMVERPVYDDLMIEYENLKNRLSHLGDEKHKQSCSYEDLLNELKLLKQKHSREIFTKDQ